MPVSNINLEMDMARATLNWTLPTTRVDGVTLDPSEIDRTDIVMSADGGANFSPPASVLPTEPQAFVVENLTAGSYLFRAIVVDTAGRVSDHAEATGSVLDAPSAIADLTVTIE